MRDQIVGLIKKYRAASEKCWTPDGGYRSHHHAGQSYAYSKCADDLEKLLLEYKEAL